VCRRESRRWYLLVDLLRCLLGCPLSGLVQFHLMCRRLHRAVSPPLPLRVHQLHCRRVPPHQCLVCVPHLDLLGFLVEAQLAHPVMFLLLFLREILLLYRLCCHLGYQLQIHLSFLQDSLCLSPRALRPLYLHEHLPHCLLQYHLHVPRRLNPLICLLQRSAFLYLINLQSHA
jgi:hypothetical protein